MQNTSHAVMAQRAEPRDSLDDFPTPPWATRALIEHVIEQDSGAGELSVLEPACGRGHMAQVLSEYFKEVSASDVHAYGYGAVSNFLTSVHEASAFDWVITNPPFRLAEDFVLRALPIARRGVAMLVRTVFIESVGRYERVFTRFPPARVAQFTERVPMIKGRVDRKASTATGYAWVIWEKACTAPTALTWVPPCRKSLERAGDYEAHFLMRDRSDHPRQQELFA
ncbi:class I SAM-dependent methyltransferase [Limibaculum sp. FT325]|uniref:class I SAM-dependent methyltransferase n=1 Tax=Thermohalobaculum sediminis TaxID=2939436 RepID=UPI0020C0CE47|nr:class I SAM-dependent methyltransferase [Limibaculum sediminis]MCL5779277.1 class I SAM-dependent methyltransferase [Limibaculum sediminis]